MHHVIRRCAAAALLLLSAAGGAGCSAGAGSYLVQPMPLDEAQQRYTRLVRWGELQRAGDYVDPAMREAFLNAMDRLAGLRITDYETERIEQTGDGTAVAHVTYTAYSRASLVDVGPVAEVQEWYRDPDTREWRVRPDLARLHAVASRLQP